MKYIDSVEKDFVELNKILGNLLEYKKYLEEFEDSELKDHVSNLYDKTVSYYKSFVYKNDIQLDRIPDEFKFIFNSNIKK